jgi:hypothetical protein
MIISIILRGKILLAFKKDLPKFSSIKNHYCKNYYLTLWHRDCYSLANKDSKLIFNNIFKEHKMKKLLILVAMASLVLFGCSDLGTNNMTNPVSSSSSAQSKTIIQLPAAANGQRIEDINTVSKTILSLLGGNVSLTDSYTTSTGSTVSVNASLSIPPLAFNGLTMTFSITSDPTTASLEFGPHTTFNKPLTLNVTYTGIDLSDSSSDGIGFYYISDDGTFYPINNSGITYDAATQTLTVHNAQINHFSRYGFAK